MKRKLLILGGTGDSREIAAAASLLPNVEVISSLAGRTQNPASIPGEIRVGSFGGAAGLAAYIREEKINYLIDATHPFASQISMNALTAANECQIPHLLYQRPPWQREIEDTWYEVDSLKEAAVLLPNLAKRVFLTIGRQEVKYFANLRELWFLIRSIEPSEAIDIKGEIILDRGPFSLAEESHLLEKYCIDTIVTKNSGGRATYAKIIAARQRRIPIIMIRRSALPNCEVFTQIEDVIIWLDRQI
jgi:precorrin-6A/cobalt-precorrin-6A reductase